MLPIEETWIRSFLLPKRRKRCEPSRRHCLADFPRVSRPNLEALFRSKGWAELQELWAYEANHEPSQEEKAHDMERGVGCLQGSVVEAIQSTPVKYGIAVGHYQRLMRQSGPNYGKDLINTLWPPKEEENGEEES